VREIDTNIQNKSVKKAIIPVAGFGTRMYPASRFIKKVLFPIVDENGTAKPLILYLFEELDEIDIEEIILIVGKGEVEYYESFFNSRISEEHIGKLPKEAVKYETLISKVSKKIRYAVQEKQRGFGHAVYQAKPFINNEPVLLLLGDMIFRSDLDISCSSQIINAFSKSGEKVPVVAVKEIPVEDVIHYGIIKGDFDGNQKNIMNAVEMTEKPTVEYAKENFGVIKKNKTAFFAISGQYILTSDVFAEIEADIDEHDSSNDDSEIQLTDALRKVLKTKGLIGVRIEGEIYDVGTPKAYVNTVSAFPERTKVWQR